MCVEEYRETAVGVQRPRVVDATEGTDSKAPSDGASMLDCNFAWFSHLAEKCPTTNETRRIKMSFCMAVTESSCRILSELMKDLGGNKLLLKTDEDPPILKLKEDVSAVLPDVE